MKTCADSPSSGPPARQCSQRASEDSNRGVASDEAEPEGRSARAPGVRAPGEGESAPDQATTDSGFSWRRAPMTEGARKPSPPLGGICRRKVAAPPAARGHEAAMPQPLLNLARQTPARTLRPLPFTTARSRHRSKLQSINPAIAAGRPSPRRAVRRSGRFRTFVRLVGIAADHRTVYVAQLKSKVTREEPGLEKKCRVRCGGPYK
jgi:hypothetical protein